MPDLIAYQLYDPQVMPLRLDVSPPNRDWMDATPNRFANRCLPLLMASQSGWVIRQKGRVTATWLDNNSGFPGDINIMGNGPVMPTAHFGGGTLTWHIPWLFRTPPGWNLLLRGPINEPKDGAAPLEGLLESDWMTQTTTYSWRLTRPHHPVVWEDGDPVAVIVPVRRDDLEEWAPREEPIPADVEAEVAAFGVSRAAFNAGPRLPRDWQKDYAKGMSPGGSEAPPGEHRKRRNLCPFTGAARSNQSTSSDGS